MKTKKATFYFRFEDFNKPITYHLVKDYDLRINILHADIDQKKEGILFIELTGEEGNIEDALKFVQEQGVRYKLFTQTVIWNEDECIHCGTCTAVCPTGALMMDKKDWSLRFEADKCIACGQCVDECPLRVIQLGL